MLHEMNAPDGAAVPYVSGPQTEPLRGRAAWVAAAGLIVSAATAWGLKLTADQTAVVIGVLAFVGPFAVAEWSRRHVNSPATMKNALAAQRAALTADRR